MGAFRCANCGTYTDAKRSDALYCGATCRKDAHRRTVKSRRAMAEVRLREFEATLINEGDAQTLQAWHDLQASLGRRDARRLMADSLISSAPQSA